MIKALWLRSSSDCNSWNKRLISGQGEVSFLVKLQQSSQSWHQSLLIWVMCNDKSLLKLCSVFPALRPSRDVPLETVSLGAYTVPATVVGLVSVASKTTISTAVWPEDELLFSSLFGSKANIQKGHVNYPFAFFFSPIPSNRHINVLQNKVTSSSNRLAFELISSFKPVPTAGSKIHRFLCNAWNYYFV